jgi:hypothetical protein
VGPRDKLESVLSTLITATRSGELDAFLEVLAKKKKALGVTSK